MYNLYIMQTTMYLYKYSSVIFRLKNYFMHCIKIVTKKQISTNSDNKEDLKMHILSIELIHFMPTKQSVMRQFL